VHPDEGPLPIDLYALGRGAAYLAALLLVGVVAAGVLAGRLRRSGGLSASLAERALPRAALVALAATLLLLAACGLRLYGQVRSFLDPGEEVTRAFVAGMLETGWGRGWLAQVAAAAAAFFLAGLAAIRPDHLVARLLPAALGVVFTSPLTGHAVENPWGPVAGVVLHGTHLLGGGLWLGTLACLFIGAILAARDDDAAAVADLVRWFSPFALVGAGVAVGIGLAMSYAYVGSLDALGGTTYGRALLLKAGLLGCTALVGAWNWKRVTPALGAPAGTSRLARSVTVELLIGLGLVAVTSVLVALPAPRI
jgi:copper transport protein